MGLFSSLFKKSDPPNKSWRDDILGSTVWSDDEEEWLGDYKGRRFGIAYENTSQPSDDVVAFAREILGDPGWLDATLHVEKLRAKEKMGHEFSNEIDALHIELVSFWRQRSDLVIFVTLNGGDEYRAWRMEFLGRNCVGIGFDS